ncbi:MAG: GspE/PulE family protein [bacterium]|nr:GspE/PulE family protein [bacterium]
MADPKQPEKKTPGIVATPSELAVKANDKNRNLVKTGAKKDLLQMAGGDKALQTWVSQFDAEGAARMRQELVTTGYMEEGDILDVIAAGAGMEKVLLSAHDIPAEVIGEVTPEIARKYNVVPVRATANELWLAISDPHNVQILDDVARILNKHVHGMVTTEDEIERALKRYYASDNITGIYETLAESDDPAAYAKKWDEIDLTEKESDDIQPPVVKYVDLIFAAAVHDRASDIHVEPTRHGVTIRFRIDGVLHEVPSPPRKWQNAIISRLKVMAGMDLAEKRVPLDGRIRLTTADKKLDLRVSSLPTIFGESIVMRILDQSQVMMGLEDVGFLPNSVRLFKELIKAPNGVILMTGPTGSGKTTTLYAALSVLNTPENKLVTLEDPVEYQIPGINQIQINTDIGLDFPMGLRSVLRQSPDVILVGEIRDRETAENAVRAALTGHLVFSTLHTNDAPSSTVRLIDMGIKPYLVASSLHAVIAQRLVRRICGSCKEAYHPPAEAIVEMAHDPDEFRNVDFFRGRGCERCNHNAYRGRTAIHEIMVMDPDLRRRVIRSEPASRIKRAALAKGMLSLRMDGWEKVLLGWTTIDEVLRITQSDV